MVPLFEIIPKVQKFHCFTIYVVPKLHGLSLVLVSAKFDTCTVVSVNGALVEVKMCTFTLESTHFIFNKCPICTHDGASVQFSTDSHETDFSVCFYLIAL